MPTITVTVSDEEEKALLWKVVSLQEWADNAIHSKARKCMNEICMIAIEDKTHTIITKAEKIQLRDWLNNNNIILSSVNQLPNNIKDMIVAAANIKSAAERKAEFESTPIVK